MSAPGPLAAMWEGKALRLLVLRGLVDRGWVERRVAEWLAEDLRRSRGCFGGADGLGDEEVELVADGVAVTWLDVLLAKDGEEGLVRLGEERGRQRAAAEILRTLLERDELSRAVVTMRAAEVVEEGRVLEEEAVGLMAELFGGQDAAAFSNWLRGELQRVG